MNITTADLIEDIFVGAHNIRELKPDLARIAAELEDAADLIEDRIDELKPARQAAAEKVRSARRMLDDRGWRLDDMLAIYRNARAEAFALDAQADELAAEIEPMDELMDAIESSLRGW